MDKSSPKADKGVPPQSKGEPKPGPMPRPNLEALKLPSGAIIVVTENARDALQAVDAVILSPEKFKKLSEQVEQLNRLLAARKPEPPTSCELEARVESRGGQPFVRVKATFQFKTETPGTAVFLGCRRARPASASLDDGRLPLLLAGEDGLTLLVDAPGKHALRLDLELPLLSRGSRGNELGFEVGLPGAPVTVLTMDAPHKVERVNVARRVPEGKAEGPPRPPEVERVDVRRLRPGQGMALGLTDRLEVWWEDPAAGAAQSSLQADADVHVRVEENAVSTTARLHLKGTAREWKFLAPAAAEVSVEPYRARNGEAPAPKADTPAAPGASSAFPPGLTPDVVRPAPKGPPVWQVRFKEPVAADLLVVVQVSAPRPRGFQAVGPFAVLGVFPQPGVIRVSAPPHLRVNFRTHGDVRRQELRVPPGEVPGPAPFAAEDDAVFRYPSPPVSPKRGNPKTEPELIAPLEIEVQPAQGAARTQVHHHLQLAEGGWRLRTEIRVTPVRAEIDRLELEVPAPPDFQNVVASPPELVEGLSPVRDAGPKRRVIQIKLAGARRAPFAVTLEGFYPVAEARSAERGTRNEDGAGRGGDDGRALRASAEATLPLPRLLHAPDHDGRLLAAFDRDGQVTATVPEGYELRGAVREWEGDRVGAGAQPLAAPAAEGPRPAGPPAGGPPLTLTAAVRRSPAEVDLTWGPYRPETAEVQADVTFGDRQARVTQQITCSFTEGVPRKLRLRGPRELAGVSLPSGPVAPVAPGEWLVPVAPASPADRVGNKVTVTLHYAFALPARPAGEASPFAVPLLWPEAASCEAKVRVWREPGASARLLPVLAAGPWTAPPPELERDRIPALTLEGSGTDLPLRLRLEPSPDAAANVPWVERALIQAEDRGAGATRYRCRFRFGRWSGPFADLELPAGAADLRVFLNGRPLEPGAARPAPPAPGGGPEGIRVPVPPYRPGRSLLLDVQYQLPASARGGRWEVSFQPARVRGAAVGDARWQIGLPPQATPLYFGDAAGFEERWVLSHGLPASVAGRSRAEMERWLASGLEPSAPGAADAAGAGWEGVEATLSGRQAGLGPLRLVVVPRVGWFLAVSLGVLAAGLLASRLPRPLLWLLLAVVGVAGAASAFLWPQPAGQALVAALPGLLVLVLVLGVQRYLHARYLRRLVYLPGFSRVQAHSSMVRSGSSKRATREPSTIDAPAPVESGS